VGTNRKLVLDHRLIPMRVTMINVDVSVLCQSGRQTSNSDQLHWPLVKSWLQGVC